METGSLDTDKEKDFQREGKKAQKAGKKPL